MTETEFFTLPSPFDCHAGTLYLQEPPESRAGALRACLLDESYDKPFVLDDGECRYLYFNVRLMQSAMRLKLPDLLEIRYTQKMMACLLFKPKPKRLLLIGLGGGSIVKFCYRRLPGTQVTAVELNPAVIAFRSLFKLPDDDERLQIVCADGAEYLAAAERGLDVILLDAFDKEGYVPELARQEFFELIFDKLSGAGVLVVNLAGEHSSYGGLVGRVMAAFDDRVIVISVPEDGNHVLYAFKDRNFDPRWKSLTNQAKELKAHYGLDFPRFVEKIERASKQGVARRLQFGEYV
ncbi:spermidine synthase-like protein [Dechloromonas sp.]|uniref:spermine/spermidine synthase domain-containing protein n=1 Tax=Dechloromonas sp. TaxID=1917218 RepID=UPI00263F91AD|nr:spermidine synthase-like protein [Dechloromonas sp.]